MALRDIDMIGDAMRDHRTDDDYYTEKQLRNLLYLYPYLLDGKPPKDDDLAEVMWQNLFGLREGWHQKAARKCAEVSRGMRWLDNKHSGICYATRAFYIVGLSTRDIADYLARVSGHSVHNDTVNEWRKKGFQWLLDYLNGDWDE